MTDRKQRLYDALAADFVALIANERDVIANAANLSSLIFHALPDVNWAGFYFVKGGELVLGPFQGRPACVRIAMGKGVCGTSAQRRETIVVADVREFSEHIACDAASRSEIVVPLMKGRRLIGVLDVDSPVAGRFDSADRDGLERLGRMFIEGTDTAARP